MKYKDNDNVGLIFSTLKSRILAGKLKTGDRLIETKIASEFNVSRLHVKAALRMLMAEQLASYAEMKGFRVVGVSEDTLEEVIQIRQALEAVVIKRVIKIATQEDIDNLSRIVARLKVFVENKMTDDCFEELTKFYQTLYSICGYTRITAILLQYKDYIDIILRQSAPTAEDHLAGFPVIIELMDAIKGRDEKRAMSFLDKR